MGKKLNQPFGAITKGDILACRGYPPNDRARMLCILAIFRLLSKGKGYVQISYREIKDWTGLRYDAISRSIKYLEQLTLIRINRGRAQRKSIYQLLPSPIMQEEMCAPNTGAHALPIRERTRSQYGSALKGTVDNSRYIDSEEINSKEIGSASPFSQLIQVLKNYKIQKAYPLAVKMHEGGLDLDDWKTAVRIAKDIVLAGKTRRGQEVNLKKLSKDLLDAISAYAIGIIENTIDAGLDKVKKSKVII